MIVRISINELTALDFTSICGQSGNSVICEVETAPAFEHEELMEDFNNFTQTYVPHVWEKSYHPSIAEIKVIKGWIEALGEKANELKTYEGLKLAYENKLLQEEVDTLAMAVLSLMEV